MKDDINVKGLSTDEVYNIATWRRMPSCINSTSNWEYYEEGEEAVLVHVSPDAVLPNHDIGCPMFLFPTTLKRKIR